MLRIGETFALEWSNIDFKLNVLHVTQRIYKGKLGTPKSASSEASIYMLKPFVRILKEWKLQCPLSRWIIFSPSIRKKDHPMSTESWYRGSFRPVCSKYHLDITYHHLRHLGAQFLRNQGIPLDYLQAQLRHATIATTADIYSEVSGPAIRKSINDMDEILLHIIEDPQYKVIENGD